MKTTTKTLTLAIGFAFLLLSMNSCQEQTTATDETTVTEEIETPAPPTVEELGRMNREFAKALVAKDAMAAALEYDENASLLPPNEPIITGRENIRAYWQGLIDAGLIDASVETIDAGSDGELGYEIGTFELKIQGEDGSVIVDKGKFTEILKLNEEGKWISLYGMWSGNEPAAH